MATLCEMTVFSVSLKSWSSAGLRTASCNGSGKGVSIRTMVRGCGFSNNSGQKRSSTHTLSYDLEAAICKYQSKGKWKPLQLESCNTSNEDTGGNVDPIHQVRRQILVRHFGWLRSRL